MPSFPRKRGSNLLSPHELPQRKWMPASAGMTTNRISARHRKRGVRGARAAASTIELHTLAELRIIQLAVVPGEMAVDPRRSDTGTERVALERRPAALRQ